MDIVMYCLTPGHQVRSGYRTGKLDPCWKEWDGLKACIRAKALSKSDPERARKVLYDWTVKWLPPPPPPIWRMRRVPPILHNSQTKNKVTDPSVVLTPELVTRKSDFFGPQADGTDDSTIYICIYW